MLIVQQVEKNYVQQWVFKVIQPSNILWLEKIKKGKDYQGGRDFDSLKKFVENDLAKGCDVDQADTCDERETKYIDKMKAKGAEKITKELGRLNGMKDKSMKPENKKWMMKRINVLEQLNGKSDL